MQEAIHLAFTGPTKPIPRLYQPTLVHPIRPMSPLYSAHSIQTPMPPPPAPVTATIPQYAAVKVDHLDPYKGKVGSKAKQWLTCMLAWVRLNQRMFPTQMEILSFLLMNMEDMASTWALAMELDWNNAAICSQFAQGLHWEVPAATRKDPKDSGCIKICNITSANRLSPLFTILIKPEKAEQLEVLIDSGATSSFLHQQTTKALCLPLIDLPQPCIVTMLDGSSPQAGKIWKKANLTFSFDGKKMTETFSICNTGSHSAILGLKWLDAHNPEIDWSNRALSFPHSPPEYVTIAKEEEADPNPLEGVPPEYHQYAKLTEEGPLNSPLYSMTNAKSLTLKDWLRDELKAEKIHPSKSSISSPVMFVPKDGSCQLVITSWLNSGAKVFTKLDLQWGYNNVQVKEGNKWKTTFHTKYSLYKSLVMTFGLTNAPAAFQHFMNKLFKELLDVCIIIYLDDILIYSKDGATHTQHVHEVLHCLMENQLFCKALKCTFHITSVEYLGIIVSDKGFSLDKLKIQAVQEWPVPTKVKEVQLFLGFANFLRQFVANFSHMARPLHNLVKKDTPWKWDTKEQEAFQGLKDTITNAPVLCHTNPAKPYFLETDASGAALGSILSQRQDNGRLHPMGFLSESFKGAEQNYDTHDKELLASIRSFEYWRIFLEGTLHPITVFTNHCNLEYWKESQMFNHLLPEKELQQQIESSLDQDKSLEEILQFLQNKSKAPPSIKYTFKDYEMEAGLLFYQGRIVVPDIGTLRTDLLWIFHDSPMAGHPGRQQTLELVSQNYYWPVIRADTYWHMDSCKICQCIHKPKYAPIPLQPLEIPAQPWQHILYNMIVDLPRDGNHNSILVIVDSFTKYSDRQTECVNPSVEHFLRAYSGINQRDWVKWLPMAEFAYNNPVHSATGKSPFKAMHGWEPTLTPSNVPMDVPEADDFAAPMEAQWKEIESALWQSKTRMIAREEGSLLEFEIGEEAWLDTKNLKLKTHSPKLTEQQVGLFKVIEKISDCIYQLELPPTMQVHNIFYVGLLSKVKRDKNQNFENRPPPVTIDGKEEYKVEGITNMEERDGKWFF
ncbi:hypothetical protein RHS01_11142 [Rhizoctonia solani]|uniref:Reverse transcriptase n=1 Tax=Rhizoctonia solani TaxID=456999 RepID=A0A8H7LZW4_9AGAM|nr:hypothetical protein RHS01_11142 [Rhizoctonia solani]